MKESYLPKTYGNLESSRKQVYLWIFLKWSLFDFYYGLVLETSKCELIEHHVQTKICYPWKLIVLFRDLFVLFLDTLIRVF